MVEKIREAMEASCWQIDRKVGLALVLTLLVQFGGTVWWTASWTASTEARVTALEKGQVRLEARDASHEEALQCVQEMRVDVRWIKDRLQRMENARRP